ncbi:hypothetical protein [Streptomyces sp. NPDC049040]|uniref:hypothetical protein n=1 Tax=Streptomyces sp. NPDC049040 TaxID=3365593 RepID=UPI00371E0BE2
MGYSVLYIAFGIVALWLLGEVLLQYKARLRWRVLAFCGFLGVVVGVAMREVAVIVLGAVAFGAGQSFVTLSYKRGFSTGWALGGRPGSSRRRKGGAGRTEPVLEVGPVEEDEFAFAGVGADSGTGGTAAVAGERTADPAAAGEAVYQPTPLHEDSGEYPVYDGQSSYTPDPYTSGGYEGYGTQGYQDWGTGQQPAAASYGYQNGQDGGYDTGSGHAVSGGWEGDQAAAQYGGQQQGYDGYGQGGYQQQPAAGYGYGQHVTGDWTPQPPQPPADPYGYGYPSQQEQQQPYIPPQQPYEPDPQHQQPYEQQPSYDPQQQPQYADPYDPYRY